MFGDSVKYGLQISPRATNNRKNLTGRNLLLQRFLELVEQSHVLDGDHGLVSERFEKLDLRGGERAHLDATCAQRSNDFPMLTKGSGQESAPAATGGIHRLNIVLLTDVGNVKRTMLVNPTLPWLIHTDLGADSWYGTKMSPRNQNVSFAQSQHHVIDSTHTRGALDNRVEDRLHVRGRTADDTEHLRRCRLMLQGFAQFCVPLLNLFEQANVLYGDHRLVSEGFD